MGVNPIDIEQLLQGSTFPADKNTLIGYARQSHATNEIISALEKLPDKQYPSATDAAREAYRPEFRTEDQYGSEACDD